jgi:hypothetical protein
MKALHRPWQVVGFEDEAVRFFQFGPGCVPVFHFHGARWFLHGGPRMPDHGARWLAGCWVRRLKMCASPSHCRHHCLQHCRHHCRHCHCRQRARFCPSMRSSMRSSCRGVGGEEQPYPLWCCRRHQHQWSTRNQEYAYLQKRE